MNTLYVRVLHVQKASGIAGAERHLLALLPALERRGIEVRACVLTTGEGSRFVGELREAAIPVFTLPAGPDVNPTLIAQLVGEIRRFGADLVHTHLVHADFHGQLAARTAGVRAVSSVHGAHSFVQRGPFRIAAQFAQRLSRRTIAISHHVASALVAARVADPASVRVVHYGIDSAAWAPGPGEEKRARAEWGIAPHHIVVGVASRLMPGKGHEVLIDAMASAVRREPRLRLLVAGVGPSRPDLEARAASLPPGAVRFVGFVPEIRRFMLACDLLAFPTLPSLGEGFGLAALEAMACGRPVVASAVASLPEVVSPDTGVLVQPADTRALADTLVQLASDRSRLVALGRAAGARAATAFSIDTMVERTLLVYDEALELTRLHPRVEGTAATTLETRPLRAPGVTARTS